LTAAAALCFCLQYLLSNAITVVSYSSGCCCTELIFPAAFPVFSAAAWQAPVTANELTAKPPGTTIIDARRSSTLAGPTATATVKSLPCKAPAAECCSADIILAQDSADIILAQDSADIILAQDSADVILAQDSTSAQQPWLGDTFLPLPRSPILACHAASTTPLLSGSATISPTASMISHCPALVNPILENSKGVVKTIQFRSEVEPVSVASSPVLCLRAATAAPAAASAVKGSKGLGGKGVGVGRKLLRAVQALPLGALVAATSISSLIWIKCCS
jgi:hypothetical protein